MLTHKCDISNSAKKSYEFMFDVTVMPYPSQQIKLMR